VRGHVGIERKVLEHSDYFFVHHLISVWPRFTLQEPRRTGDAFLFPAVRLPHCGSEGGPVTLPVFKTGDWRL
jgi:hypothetical protein